MNAKKILSDTLFKMANTEPLEKITVESICKEATVSKSTFYRHFIDKYDLISWSYMEHVNELQEKYFNGEIDLRKFYRDIYELFRQNGSFYYSALIINGQNSFMEWLAEYSFAFYRKQFGRTSGNNTINEYKIKYINAGEMAMVKKWLDDPTISIDEIVQITIDMLPQELRGL